MVAKNLIHPMNNEPKNTLVPLATAAACFGYRETRHFREAVAPRHGLNIIRQGNRWFANQREIDSALAALAQAASSTSTPAQ